MMFRDLVHAVALSSARFALQRKSPIGPRHGHLTDLSSAQPRRSPYQPCFPLIEEQQSPVSERAGMSPDDSTTPLLQ
jgi:hypothetical protein